MATCISVVTDTAFGQLYKVTQNLPFFQITVTYHLGTLIRKGYLVRTEQGRYRKVKRSARQYTPTA